MFCIEVYWTIRVIYKMTIWWTAANSLGLAYFPVTGTTLPIKVTIHLAARVHVMQERAADPGADQEPEWPSSEAPDVDEADRLEQSQAVLDDPDEEYAPDPR